MGNHTAGRAMAQTAVALAGQRERTGQTALDMLDIACAPWGNCDAEFDEEDMPDRPFGQLLVEAFADGREYRPGYVYTGENEDADDYWWWSENVSARFSERFNLF